MHCGIDANIAFASVFRGSAQWGRCGMLVWWLGPIPSSQTVDDACWLWNFCSEAPPRTAIMAGQERSTSGDLCRKWLKRIQSIADICSGRPRTEYCRSLKNSQQPPHYVLAPKLQSLVSIIQAPILGRRGFGLYAHGSGCFVYGPGCIDIQVLVYL